MKVIPGEYIYMGKGLFMLFEFDYCIFMNFKLDINSKLYQILNFLKRQPHDYALIW